MKNYAIVSEKNNKNWQYHVKEIPTDQIIDSYSTSKDARFLYKKLKSGSGFRGYTPNFFLKKVNIGFKEK